MKEIWKDIVGYEGLYQVSNLGNVKSLNFNHTGKEKIMKQIKHHTGYIIIGLVKNGIKKQHMVHKLVINAFNQNKDNVKFMPYENFNDISFNNLDVNHKDENKENNKLSNLEYCTRLYNTNYGTRGKRISKNGSKPVNQYDLDGNFIKRWNSLSEISKELNITSGNISMCCTGKYKTTHGYKWKYANK